MRHPQNHIFAHTPETLAAWCESRGMQQFRAKQILEWVYQHGVADPALMSNLSKRDREILAAEMTFLSGEIVGHQAATDGTQKLLIEWADYGEGTEAQRHKGTEGGSDEATERRSDGGGTSVGLPVLGSAAIGAGGGDPSRQTECVMIPALGAKGAPPRRGERAGTPTVPGGRGRTDQQSAGDLRRSRVTPGWAPRDAGGTHAAPRDAGGTQGGAIRRTACISSQVGCPVGCRFCASGLGGLDGNLSTGRIVEQVWRLNQLLADPKGVHAIASGAKAETSASGSSKNGPASAPRDGGGTQGAPRITNIVFMGMGEPLANARNVIPAVRTLAAPWALNISARKITISTVGLPKAIEKLADELELPVTLALSLHAPTDEIRRSLIPWAEYSTIDELLAACDKWFRKTGREITLEYTLMAGVNDRPQHARLLVNLCRKLRANVNLIRYNEVAGLPFQRPANADVLRFQEELRAAGVNVHIRASRGRDIAAACGQLRHEAAAAG